MPIIKAPPKQPKSVTIQARVEEAIKDQLDRYAEFIDSTPSYVITEALKDFFKRDDEFKTWLGQHANRRTESRRGSHEDRVTTCRPVQHNSVCARTQRPQDSMPRATQQVHHRRSQQQQSNCCRRRLRPLPLEWAMWKSLTCHSRK